MPHAYDSFSECSIVTEEELMAPTAESETDFADDELSSKEFSVINDDFMSDEEYEVSDGDWKIFPLVMTAADNVCVKLNELIQSGKVPRDKIFYKYLNDMVHIMINYDHKFDEDVVEFFNTIEYLGGGSTLNFIRGPMYHGQGRGGQRNVENAAFNLGGPSKTTRDKRKGGYSTKSGVLKDLHLAFITLASEITSKVSPLVETKSVKVIGIAMENDGTAIKPGIQFDERMKRNVGLKQYVDLKFVKENPSPTAEFLRENVITEVNVSFITSLCNTISMPVAVSYHTKGGKTGEDMKELLLGQIQTLQLCKGCLERTPANELTVNFSEGVCCSSCEECLKNKEICTTCAEKNQPSHAPCLRACDRCLRDGKQCERCVILVLTTDCEEGNKKAMELIEQMQESETIDPALEYLAFFPDSVHVGKSLKCSFCNWFILLNGERGCLSIIQTLRDDSNPAMRKKLRKILKAEDVQNKDRMAVDPIIRLSSPEVLDALKEVSNVVHQLVPEKYRFSENNKVGMFPHPIAITCGQEGKFFFLDLNPLKRSARLVEADLHNPVRSKVVKTQIPMARSLCYLKGIGTVVTCCDEGQALQVVDIEDRVTLKASRLKDRASLVAELERRRESCDGTVKCLKQRLEACLLEEQRMYQSQGKTIDIVHLDQDIKPSTICALSDHLLGCSCDASREVYTIEIQTNGHFLSGTVNKFCDFTPLCDQVRSMCLSTDGYLVLAHNSGITKLKMADQEVKEYPIANGGQARSSIQAVAPLSGGKVAFTDQTKRQVKQIESNGAVTVIAGTGEEGNKNGSGSSASFGQPMGLCIEGDNIFVTDGQIGAVKLVTTVTGTIQFLENLGKFYGAFSVHLKNKPAKRHTIEEAYRMVKDVSSYIKSTVSSVQEIRNSGGTTNGPQGTVASKTVKSVHLVEKGLNKLRLNLAGVNPSFKIEPEVCLTLQVESQHAVSHFKHPSCTVLDYARDFGNTMHESLKRTSQWAAYYFTHRNSYYPVPENHISLRDIPKMSPLPNKEMSQTDQTTMREWAQEHGKAVRQRTVRQCTTKHNAGTLPLNMYEKELPIGERVTLENSYQDSEYDSGSDEESSDSAEGASLVDVDLNRNAINFLSRSIRTRSGRVISLSHRALASYQ